jgi:hypothetical protein
MNMNEDQLRIIALEIISSDAYLLVNKKLLIHYGPDTAIYLSNLVDKYRYYKSKNELIDENWFYLKHEKQMNELGLTERRIRNCKAILKKDEIIQTKFIGLPAKEYYFINWNNILNFLKLGVRAIGHGTVRARGHGTVRANIYNNNKGNTNNKEKEDKKRILPKGNNFLLSFPAEEEENKRISPILFNSFWEIYPKKTDKGKALTSWNRICSRKNGEKPTWSMIRKAIFAQKETERWADPNFIPHPTTWLNQSRWLDDPKEMKGSWVDEKEESGYVSGFVGKSSLKYKKSKIV